MRRCIQNRKIEQIQYPAGNPSNTAIRAEFHLDTFPPHGGNKKKPAPPVPPAS
jgi:hypothetical protein